MVEWWWRGWRGQSDDVGMIISVGLIIMINDGDDEEDEEDDRMMLGW